MRVPTAKEFFFSQAPLDARAREERERAFFHAIRLRNGTNKTTYARRLNTVNAVVNRVLAAHRPLEIMDAGVSSGISTLEWMNDLDSAAVDYRMIAGDLCVKGIEIPLIDPQLKERACEIVEDDLLTPNAFERRFDVVRAANVLNRYYFCDETLVAMAATLRGRLKRHGILIVCRTDEHDINHGTVFLSNEPRRLEVMCRIGNGSESELIPDTIT